MVGTDQTSKCRACGSSPTIQAHIIPQSFAREAKGAEKHLFLIGDQHKINQSGLFDRNILCGPCDQRLGVYDKYAYEFCKSIQREVLPSTTSELVLTIRYNADTEKLVRFAYAVIYRASISDRPDFVEFSLGDFENVLWSALFSSGDGETTHFGEVLMVRYSHTRVNPMDLFSYPYRSEFNGRELAIFSLGGFRFMIRVGGFDFSTKFPHLVMNGKPHLTSLLAAFERTSEFQGLLGKLE